VAQFETRYPARFARRGTPLVRASEPKAYRAQAAPEAIWLNSYVNKSRADPARVFRFQVNGLFARKPEVARCSRGGGGTETNAGSARSRGL
jgi:hypothetical protein